MQQEALEVKAVTQKVRKLRLRIEDGEVRYTVELEEALRELESEAEEGYLTVCDAGKVTAS